MKQNPRNMFCGHRNLSNADMVSDGQLYYNGQVLLETDWLTLTSLREILLSIEIFSLSLRWVCKTKEKQNTYSNNIKDGIDDICSTIITWRFKFISQLEKYCVHHLLNLFKYERENMELIRLVKKIKNRHKNNKNIIRTTLKLFDENLMGDLWKVDLNKEN